ncbi:hypothetical protein EPUL_006029 [Erysiphe pulchra]|uniref:Uncharacterized protein n=1 Tax=Erysiphe pulchra TaxID=225359 RepID=A0A2S4PLU3_9PEZI|nr:hypothetical protein EPUL_006029 [Erysiphe pulchra]
MQAIKCLLDLTNDCLENLEIQHPAIRFDSLALIADGASRQNKEDRRVKIRLKLDHEAQENGSFELHQTIQKLVPGSLLVSDIWIDPSGIAVLAPFPAKAAAVLQEKKLIKDIFGKILVECQGARTSFVIGSINKKIRCLDGMYDQMDGLLQKELAHFRDTVPIRVTGWTRRSQNDEPYGYFRICVPDLKAGKFPLRLHIFGEAISIQRIRKCGQIVVCSKCHDFQVARTCARSIKCQNRGMNAHDSSCDRSPKCLNCLGHHCSTDLLCPARSRYMNGVFVYPTGVQLKHIRAAGRREFLKVKKYEADNPSPSPSFKGAAETGITLSQVING